MNEDEHSNSLPVRQVTLGNLNVTVNLVSCYEKEDMKYLCKKAVKLLKAIKDG